MAEHASVIRVTHFHPAPGKADELLGLMRQVTDAAAALQGCFGAQTCRVDGSEGLVAVSRWRDQPALDAALGDNSANLSGRLEGLLAQAPQTEHYRPVA